MNVKRNIFISVLVSLMAVLSIVDSQISTVVAFGTGIRLGIANIVLLVAMNYFDFKDLVLMGVMKSLLVGLLLGTFSTFLIGFVGTMLSIFAMSLVKHLATKGFSYVSISFIGGIAHTTGQIITVIVYNKIPVPAMVPMMFPLYLTALITSILVGIVATKVLFYTEKHKLFKNI